MSEKSSAAGWVVQITIPGVPVVYAPNLPWRPATTTSPTFQFINVAIGPPEKAVEVVRKKFGASEQMEVRTVRRLSAEELASIPLPSGEAQPA
jgi:hypothetical protein